MIPAITNPTSKKIYLVTAVNPDDNHIISVWVKADNIPLAVDSAMTTLRSEYSVKGYLDPISCTMMNSNASKH